MTTRGPNDAPDDGPDPSGAVSSFDAAQDLLRATLDEIRGTAGQPPKAPGAAKPAAKPAAAAPEPRPGPTPRPPSEHDAWAPRPEPPATGRTAARRRQAAAAAAAATARTAADSAEATKAAPPAAPAAPTPAANTPAATTPTMGTTGTPRRLRAARTAEPAADEFAGLTDELFEAPATGGRRRRRRPEGADAVEGTTRPTIETAPDPVAPSPEPERPADDAIAPTAVGGAVAAASVAATVEPTDATLATPAAVPDAPKPVGTRPAPAPTWVDAPTATATAASDDEGSRRRTGLIAAAVAVAAAVLIAFAVVVLPGGGKDDDTALRTAPAARYTFDTVTTPEGAEVTRVWELQGAQGDEFVGRLRFVNTTDAPLPTSFTETIPKAIAPTVSDITFEPQPTVVQPDPVVRYDVTIPAGGTFTARYEAKVAAEGAERSRLEAWAKELPTDTTTTTSTTTAAPDTGPTTTTTEGRRPTSSTTPGSTAPPPTSPPEPPTTQPPPPPVGTGIIVMRVYSKGGTGSFFLSGPNTSAVVETSGSPNGFGQVGYTVDVGTYPWTLEPAEGWVFVGASCEDRGGSSDTVVSGNTVFFNVQADETVVCSFTVQKQA